MGGLEKRCRCKTAEQRRSCRCPSAVTTWRASYYHRGRRIRSQPFPRKGIAERWLAEQEAAQSRGDHVDPRDGLILFSEWSDEWAPAREAVLKRSTYLAEKGRLNKHLKPWFDDLSLIHITPSQIRRWIAQLDIAPKTIRHCHALLHAIMADAVAEGLISKNPCVGIRLPEVVRREMVCLTEPQLLQLYAEIPEQYRPLVILLSLTGMRWGEAVGLKVGRVDLLSGKLHVVETLSEPHGQLAWSTPKTRASRRTVVISPRVVDVLLPLVAGKSSDEPVFTTHWGNLIRGRMFRDQIWLPAVKRLGWSPRPRIHDLRHAHASHLIAAGVPLLAISRRLGHAHIGVTADTYGHLLPEMDDQIVAALDRDYGPVTDRPRPIATRP